MTKRAGWSWATGAWLCAAGALGQTPPRAPQPSDQLEVVATLVDAPVEAPFCGDMHLAVAMHYRVVRVVRGTFPAADLYAIHGCPEMPRRRYNGAAAGTLAAFRVGDQHRLVLRRTLPARASGPSLWPEPSLAAVPRNAVYWTVRADAVP